MKSNNNLSNLNKYSLLQTSVIRFSKYEKTLNINSLLQLLIFSPSLRMWRSDRTSYRSDWYKKTPQISNSADHTRLVHPKNATTNWTPWLILPLVPSIGVALRKCFMVPYEWNLRKNPERPFVKGMLWKGYSFARIMRYFLFLWWDWNTHREIRRSQPSKLALFRVSLYWNDNIPVATYEYSPFGICNKEVHISWYALTKNFYSTREFSLGTQGAGLTSEKLCPVAP